MAAQHVGRAVLAYARDFDQRRGHRHDDRGGDIQAPAVIRHCHAVIAGAGGDHAALGFFGRQRQQPIERAALFERTSELKVFQLKKNCIAGHPADRFRVRKRREIDLIFDELARLFDVDEGDHVNSKLE